MLSILLFIRFGKNISNNFATGTMDPGWALGGFKYAFYNLGIIPAVLFSVKHVETRKEAIGAGIIAGVIGVIPGVLLFIAMAGFYPEILTIEVPTGFIFAVTECVNGVYIEQ